MTTETNLFIHKYQPLYLKDFGENNEVVSMLKTLTIIDNLSLGIFKQINSKFPAY
jgi:hypothetical protein